MLIGLLATYILLKVAPPILVTRAVLNGELEADGLATISTLLSFFADAVIPFFLVYAVQSKVPEPVIALAPSAISRTTPFARGWGRFTVAFAYGLVLLAAYPSVLSLGRVRVMEADAFMSVLIVGGMNSNWGLKGLEYNGPLPGGSVELIVAFAAFVFSVVMELFLVRTALSRSIVRTGAQVGPRRTFALGVAIVCGRALSVVASLITEGPSLFTVSGGLGGMPQALLHATWGHAIWNLSVPLWLQALRQGGEVFVSAFGSGVISAWTAAALLSFLTSLVGWLLLTRVLFPSAHAVGASRAGA
jgi:hypothetical protein